MATLTESDAAQFDRPQRVDKRWSSLAMRMEAPLIATYQRGSAAPAFRCALNRLERQASTALFESREHLSLISHGVVVLGHKSMRE